jgi:hypothetical protein
MTDGSTGQAPGATPEAPKRRVPLDAIPVWLQAIAALLGVLVTAVGVFGLVRGPDASPSTVPVSAPPSAPAPAAVAVTLDLVTTEQAEVRGAGSFAGIDPASEVVLFVGQPVADPGADWLPVVAELNPATTRPDGRQNGRWEAARPNTAPATRYTWYAVVAPKADGAADPYADLREKGPASELVQAASQPYSTGG